jgi:hypothetical protein
MTTLYDLQNTATIKTTSQNAQGISFFNNNTVIVFNAGINTFLVDKDIQKFSVIIVGGGRSGGNIAKPEHMEVPNSSGGAGGKIAVLSPNDKSYTANTVCTINVGMNDQWSTFDVGDRNIKVPPGDYTGERTKHNPAAYKYYDDKIVNKIVNKIDYQNQKPLPTGGPGIYTVQEKNDYKDRRNDWTVTEYSGGIGGSQDRPGTDADTIVVYGQSFKFGGGGGGGGTTTYGANGYDGIGGAARVATKTPNDDVLTTPGSGGGGGKYAGTSDANPSDAGIGGPGIVIIILEYAGQIVQSKNNNVSCSSAVNLYPFKCLSSNNSNHLFNTDVCLNQLINDSENKLIDPSHDTHIGNMTAHIKNQNFLSLYNNQYNSNMELFLGIVIVSAVLAKMMFYPMNI